MFETIVDRTLAKAKRLNETAAWRFAIDKDVRDMIIKLNTKAQLGEEGIDAFEQTLGEYAAFTIDERLSKGLQVDHVDFKVTGQYWDSWTITVNNDAILIDVDSDRYNELVEELRFSAEHVGLTPDNLGVIIQMALDRYIIFAKRQLGL